MINPKATAWLSTGVGMLAIVTWISPQARAQILSSKRGLADNNTTYNALQSTGASWYYTWGTGPDNPGNFDAKHVPMFWNAPAQNTIDDVKNRNPEWILGFNEPERTDQAHMSVSQALSSWSTISNTFAGTSTKLISPGVADTVDSVDSNGQPVIGGRTWLSNFMTELNARKTDPQNPNYNPNLHVDAVAFHWYGAKSPSNPAGAAASFLGSVDLYHNTYGLPVFITEFAIHDWDGIYSDTQIIEANRQFLDIVVPALESRTYVAGYSWFGLFSDSPLYSGSPSAPTPMAYSYIGAVGTGQVTNIGGQNLGEHVAYLTGGELTMTGATLGTIRYINALANESTISGGLDWGLNAASNWVRVQPGATLRKSGVDQITFGAGTVTNNGVLEVAQGSLRLGVSVAGTGSARVTGGTLALTGSGRLNTAPLIDVQSGGTLDVSGVSGTYNVANAQTLNNSGAVTGNVTATSGSTVTGGGTFANNLTIQSGSTVRVGLDGSGVARRIVIDNFESYALGDVRTTASPPWTAHQDTTNADIENISGNEALSYGWAGTPTDFRGVSRSLPDATVVDNTSTATIFFRLNSKSDIPNHSVGLGDKASTGTVDFADYETQLRIKQGTAAGTFALDARNGGSFTSTLANGMALNTWYNIWMVVNQVTDKYDIYMNTGTSAAAAGNKLNASPLSFRNGTAADLNTFLALAGSAPVDNAVRIDDLVFLSGLDLTNPIVNFDPGLTWNPETLSVNGNYTQSAGSTLLLNLLDTGHRDMLHVTGQATFGGTLNVSLAVGAPNPRAGDAFDILDFGSANGAFSTFNLPILTAGLVWNTSDILTSGVLKVDLLGDYNSDGKVDSADYIVWRKSGINGQQGYLDWRTNFGRASGASGGSEATSTGAVPEPTSGILIIFGSLAMMLGHCRSESC
jgi:hypothetical protein